MPEMSALQIQREALRQNNRLWLRRQLFQVLDYGLMIGLACFFIFPIWIMVTSSVKPERWVQDDLNTINAFVPRHFTLENYTCPDYRVPDNECRMPGIFELVSFERVMFNSIFIVSTIVLIGIVVNSMAAYAIARLRWPGRRLVLLIIVALIIIPFETVAIPLLLLVNQLPWLDGSISWVNSYHVQIIPFIADAFSIFLFHQFFVGIPHDLDEAARVDGASHWMIYRRIIVPLSRPVFATVAILQFLMHWGSFMWPLMVTQGEQYRPLPIAMSILFSQQPIQWGDIMAFASLVTLPVLFVFLLFQKWFVQSVASSGIKG